MGTTRQTNSESSVRPSDALAMIEACHRQQEAQLMALLMAARSLAAGRGGPDEVREVGSCADYFERSPPRHVADEEESLLPPLARRGGAAVAALIERITAEHRQHEQAHRALATAVAALPADGKASAAAASELLVAAIELGDLYRAHIALEDAELVPALRKWLTAPELEAARAEMEARRSKTPRGSGGSVARTAPAGGNGVGGTAGTGSTGSASTGRVTPAQARKPAAAKGTAKKPAAKASSRPVAKVAAKAAARGAAAAGARAKGAAKAVARPVAKKAAKAVVKLAAKAAKAVVRPAAKGAAKAVANLAAKGAAKSSSNRSKRGSTAPSGVTRRR